MKKFSSYLLALSLTIAVAGCGKDSEPTPAAKTYSANTVLLTTPKWRVTAISASSSFAGTTQTSDGYAGLQACQKDNFLKFNTDLTLTYDEGATKCSTTAAQSKPGTWSFNTAETQLTTVDPSVAAGSLGNTIAAEVLSLTATTLQVRTTNTQTVGGYTVVATATTTYAAF